MKTRPLVIRNHHNMYQMILLSVLRSIFTNWFCKFGSPEDSWLWIKFWFFILSHDIIKNDMDIFIFINSKEIWNYFEALFTLKYEFSGHRTSLIIKSIEFVKGTSRPMTHLHFTEYYQWFNELLVFLQIDTYSFVQN